MTTYYATISNAYENAGGNHVGTQADPFRESEVRSCHTNGIPWFGWPNPNIVAGDIFRLRGYYNDVNVNGLWDDINIDNLTFTSWEDGAPYYHRSTNVASDTVSNNASMIVTIENCIFSDICRVETGAPPRTYRFRNCVFFVFNHESGFNTRSSIFCYGCTFNNAAITCTGGTGAQPRVPSLTCEYCYFENTVFTTDAAWVTYNGVVTLTNCAFDTAQATVLAGLAAGTNTVLSGNSFSLSPARNLPTFNTETEDSLGYYSYGLPIVLGTPSAWVDNSYTFGFWLSVRSGYGAFNFDVSLAITVSPTSGIAPLDVSFTPNIINPDLSYLWDFGDGESSTEISPAHTYSMPGEYTGSLIVTDSAGNTFTVAFTIYVYENDYSAGGRVVTKTNRCFRFAAPQEKKQGILWSEYNGNDWPMPVGLIGTCKQLTEEDEERIIATDCNSFRHYWLGREDWWQDGGNEDYAGTEITSEILFREHTPPVGATAKLKHSESEATFRPWFKDRRDTGDYNEFGFRTAFRSSMFLREDASPDNRATVRYFPRHAQIVSDRHIEAESLQAGLTIRGAPWRLPEVQQWFEQIDTAGAPPEKQMSEKTWAELLRQPLVWIGRSNELVNPTTGAQTMPIDKGTGLRTTGSFAGVTTGPDGKARSGIVFGVADSMVTDVTLPAADMSIVMWVRSPTSPCNLLTSVVGNLRIFLVFEAGLWEIRWDDGVNIFTVPLTESLAAWNMLTLVRRGDLVEVYQNASLANTRILADTVTYGNLTFYAGAVTGYEPRIVPNDLTADAVEWLYNDVIQNEGDSVSNMY